MSRTGEADVLMYYGAVFEIKSLLALVVSVGPESKGKDFVALAGAG